MTPPPSSPTSTSAAPAAGAGATWEDLVAAALVGTARRSPPALRLPVADPDRRSPPRQDDRHEPQSAEGAAADPAAVLLAGAAVLAAYRRAGRLPGEAPARLPAPAEADGRPACSEAALDVLELILSGELPIPGGVALLAGQWLDGAARAGCRVPARLLPGLLELGSVDASLQAALRVVAGPRGRWLAGRHARWAWVVGEPADDLEAAERCFPTAARAERPAILEAVRRADPARGLELLRSTWRGDPAAERAALLAVLAVGLSDTDEPFLDAALDDRSAAVRPVAAELLGRLPRSRRAGRMAERLRSLISVEEGRPPVTPDGRPVPLSFDRPPEPDAAARRDGINDSAPAGMGVSAWRLVQVVAGTPLSFWTDELDLSPADVVDRVSGENGRADSPALIGLQRAVVAQAGRADPDWAAVLFAKRPSAAVLAALPADRAAGEFGRLLGRGVPPGPAVTQLLDACPGPWPAQLGEAVLDRYRRLGARAALELPAALPVLAARLDPAALPLVETWASTLADDQALRRRVQTLGHALSLRAVIQREFPT